MADEPGLGHNQPPPDDAFDVDAIVAKLVSGYGDEAQPRIAKLAETAEDIPVPIQGQTLAESVTLLVKQILVADQQAETARKNYKEPYLGGGRAVDTYFGQLTSPLRRAKAVAARALTQYLNAHPEIDEIKGEYGQTAFRRIVKKVKIADPTRVPTRFWIIDEKAVEKAVKEGDEVPGVEVTEEMQAVVR
jgi:hypothetical protein